MHHSHWYFSNRQSPSIKTLQLACRAKNWGCCHLLPMQKREEIWLNPHWPHIKHLHFPWVRRPLVWVPVDRVAAGKALGVAALVHPISSAPWETSVVEGIAVRSRSNFEMGNFGTCSNIRGNMRKYRTLRENHEKTWEYYCQSMEILVDIHCHLITKGQYPMRSIMIVAIIISHQQSLLRLQKCNGDSVVANHHSTAQDTRNIKPPFKSKPRISHTLNILTNLNLV